MIMEPLAMGRRILTNFPSHLLIVAYKREVSLFLLIAVASFLTYCSLVSLTGDLIRHFQAMWEALGIFFQTKWNEFLQQYSSGRDHFTLYVYGSTLLTVGLYWAIGLIYLAMDVTNLPTFIRKYKTQPGQNEPVDIKRLLPMFLLVAFNQMFVAFPFAVILFWVGELTNLVPSIETLPYFSQIVIDIAVFMLVEEVGFYYSHRLLHHRRLYKFIHKKHHEWTAPIALTAIYCHPLEHLIANTIPVALGPAIMSSHITTTWIWFTLTILRTLSDHSGYHFPLFPSPEFHDFHHLKFTECYGTYLGILDYLHGTDLLFRSSTYYKRHIVSLKAEPIRHQFPDDEEKIKTDKRLKSN